VAGGEVLVGGALLPPLPVVGGWAGRWGRGPTLPDEAVAGADPSAQGTVAAPSAGADRPGVDAVRDEETAPPRVGRGSVPVAVRGEGEAAVSGAGTEAGAFEEDGETAARVRPPPRKATTVAAAARLRFIFQRVD
jgi:hypothetical protein